MPTKAADQATSAHACAPVVDRCAPQSDYEPPTLVKLGTLTELTLGGDVPPNDDGYGDAGVTGTTS
jgi:hypothetical protein